MKRTGERALWKCRPTSKSDIGSIRYIFHRNWSIIRQCFLLANLAYMWCDLSKEGQWMRQTHGRFARNSFHVRHYSCGRWHFVYQQQKTASQEKHCNKTQASQSSQHRSKANVIHWNDHNARQSSVTRSPCHLKNCQCTEHVSYTIPLFFLTVG